MITVNGSAYKLDTIISDSSALKVDSTVIKASLFAETRVAPSLAAGVAITPSATAWKLGAMTEVLATNICATAYQVTGVSVLGANTTSGNFQLILYEGTAATTALCAVAFSAATAQTQSLHIPVVSKSVAANRVVSAKVAAATTTLPAPVIKINYKVV